MPEDEVKKRHITLEFDIDSEQDHYILACARIRDISVKALVRRVIDTLTEDQLIPSILDDEDQLRKRRRGEHTFARMRNSE